MRKFTIFNSASPLSSAYISMTACIILALLGIVLGYVEDSLTVRTNGIVFAVDIVGSFVLISAINRSIRSPDYIFNYGYGKYEALGVLLNALLLLITLGFTLLQTIEEYKKPQTIAHFPILIVFSICSFFLMRYVARLQIRRAKRFSMPILDYDAEIWKVDSLIELVVFVSLLIGWCAIYYKKPIIAKSVDGITAVVLLIIALRVPLQHGKSAINQLLDKTLSDDVQFTILSVVAENITNFCEFKSVHTRQSGKDIFVEIDVVMPFDFTFEQAYPMEKKITESVRALYANSIVRMYAVPCPRDCIKNGVCYCPVKRAQSQQVEVNTPLNQSDQQEKNQSEST